MIDSIRYISSPTLGVGFFAMEPALNWDNGRQTVIRITIEQPWSDEGVTQATSELTHLLDNVSHEVDFIIEFGSSYRLPPEGLSQQFEHYARTPFFTHPNAGHILVVTENTYLRDMIRLFSILQDGKSRKLLVTSSLANAREIIDEKHMTR